MGNVTISDLVLSPWTIKNADGTGANPDEYRMAIGIGAQLTQWYGQRINALMDDINTDATTITQLSSLMNFNPYTWGANGPAAALARTRTMESLGYNMSGMYDMASFDWYPGVNLTRNLPPLNWNDRTSPWIDPTQYLFQSGSTLYFTVNGINYEAVTSTMNMQSFVMQPDQTELDSVLPAVKSRAEGLTQTSQGKQAFLQDLIASMNKYFDFTSSILQRDERNKQEIVGHF